MEPDSRLESLLEPEEAAGDVAPLQDGIRVGELQQFLKFRHLNSHSVDRADPEQEIQAEKDFLRMLCYQLRRADKRFERETRKVLGAFALYSSKLRCAATMRALICCLPGTFSRKTPAELAAGARWCLRFAALQHAALRRVAQDRDNLLGGSLGEEFVQACFRGEVAVYAFMSPARLGELAAVEQALLARAPAAEEPQPESPGSPQPAAGSSQAAAEIEADHLCAICLDLLYQPVTLTCGHVFCARCAVAAATGGARLVGSAQLLLETPACYHSARRCPCCRLAAFGSRHEKRSPFWDVKRMVHLEAALRARYPDEWRRRKAEDAAQQAALKAQGQSSWRSWRGGTAA